MRPGFPALLAAVCVVTDRPHMFRAMGTIEVPRMRFTVGASFQHFSGKPWAASAQVALPQGDQRILLEPRGSRRLSSQSLLAVRVSRSIPFGRGRHGEILFDRRSKDCSEIQTFHCRW